MNLLKDLEKENAKTVIDLSKLTLDELNKVVYDANFLIKRKKIEQFKVNQQKAENQLKVGHIVFVTGKQFKNELFEVLKLNIKKVKCSRENGEVWNIPYSNILMS
jgi:hypothetical protein